MENSTNDPSSEKGATTPEDNQESTTQYVTGVKLVAIVSAVTLVYFLILLDMSIIVTVWPILILSSSSSLRLTTLHGPRPYPA